MVPHQCCGWNPVAGTQLMIITAPASAKVMAAHPDPHPQCISGAAEARIGPIPDKRLALTPKLGEVPSQMHVFNSNSFLKTSTIS